VAFNSLFTGFTPSDPVEAQKAAFLLKQRKSVIDLARQSSEALMKKLGKEDQLRMDRHLTEVRNLEQRVNAIAPPTEGACKMLPDPGPDPAWTDYVFDENAPPYYGITADNGWADEEYRATVMADLIHMAFVCDRSRVASFMITDWKCHLVSYKINGVISDVHGNSHQYTAYPYVNDFEKHAEVVGWHVKHFARLAAKLRDTIDVDGRPILDHTAMVQTYEGGHGFDPEANDPDSPHSTENMQCLVAGGSALGLKPGQHIATNGGYHPANAIISAMKAVGAPAKLGEISGEIPRLFA
jgi:hypothetical protein